VAAAGVDYTRIWWDARPHPRLGTLEIRIADQPTRLEVTAALATLLHAMASRLDSDGPADRGIYAQNRWAALRFGIEAELIHPDGSRLASTAELLEELAGRLGLGGTAALAQADEQLEIGRAEGLRELCRRLVSLT